MVTGRDNEQSTRCALIFNVKSLNLFSPLLTRENEVWGLLLRPYLLGTLETPEKREKCDVYNAAA